MKIFKRAMLDGIPIALVNTLIEDHVSCKNCMFRTYDWVLHRHIREGNGHGGCSRPSYIPRCTIVAQWVPVSAIPKLEAANAKQTNSH